MLGLCPTNGSVLLSLVVFYLENSHHNGITNLLEHFNKHCCSLILRVLIHDYFRSRTMQVLFSYTFDWKINIFPVSILVAMIIEVPF